MVGRCFGIGVGVNENAPRKSLLSHGSLPLEPPPAGSSCGLGLRAGVGLAQASAPPVVASPSNARAGRSQLSHRVTRNSSSTSTKRAGKRKKDGTSRGGTSMLRRKTRGSNSTQPALAPVPAENADHLSSPATARGPSPVQIPIQLALASDRSLHAQICAQLPV